MLNGKSKKEIAKLKSRLTKIRQNSSGPRKNTGKTRNNLQSKRIRGRKRPPKRIRTNVRNLRNDDRDRITRRGRSDRDRNTSSDWKSTLEMVEDGIKHNVQFDQDMEVLEPIERSTTVRDSEMKEHDGTVVFGSQYAGQVKVGDDPSTGFYTQAGDCLGLFPVQPTAFKGTRLDALARSYQRYRVDNLIMELVPIGPATAYGTIACTFLGDADRNLAGS